MIELDMNGNIETPYAGFTMFKTTFINDNFDTQYGDSISRKVLFKHL